MRDRGGETGPCQYVPEYCVIAFSVANLDILRSRLGLAAAVDRVTNAPGWLAIDEYRTRAHG
jgi:hypothetical protein